MKHTIFRVLVFGLIAISILSCVGCLNPVNIDSSGYVVTIGADVGKKQKYEVILELQRESSGESADKAGGAMVLSEEGDNIFEAISKITAGISYELNFTRVHIFIFSEELARQGLIQDFLMMSFDVLRIRQSALMLITQCTVREYLGGLNANNNANLSKLQNDLISDSKRTGMIAAINVNRFFEACNEGRFDPVLPMGFYDENVITDTKQKETATKGDNPLEGSEEGARLGGMMSSSACAALFDKGIMTGTLGPSDTQFMNIGKGTFLGGSISCQLDENLKVMVLVKLESRNVKVHIDKEKLTAEMNLKLSITVEQDPQHIVGSQWNEGMRKRLTDYFTGEMERVFALCQQSNCDAMGIGRYASMEFNTVKEWETFDWKEAYEQLEVIFNVEILLSDRYIAISRQ